MMNLSHNLILASKSPRRQQLLREAGFDFEIKTKDVDESFSESLPSNEVAKYLAKKKASAFESETQNAIVITADTVVIKDTKILGKPADKSEAFAMIRSLSGSVHQVVTGVCIKQGANEIVFDDTTLVYFKELTDLEIDYYIDNYKPFDKAGAYGIQEWIGMIGITKIEGSYFNVVGLPIQKLYEELSGFSR